MITNKFPNLFSPIKIGPLTFKNRIISAPTSVAELSSEGHLTRDNIAYYKLKARGGAAVVTVGESIVHSATGKSHPKQILLDDEGVIPSLVETADAIHQYGAIASLELSHGGMECDPMFLGGRNPIGPSATSTDIGFRTKGSSTVVVEEMDEALMDIIANAYAAGAATSKLAGFDMCVIHAGHGWLLAQFFSPLTNKRTDKYGGSVENRARFPMMVIDRIRERVGRDFPLELRISGSELTEGGLTLEDAIVICKMAEDKIDLIHVSAGAHSVIDTMTVMHPSMFLPHGCNVYLAAAIKKVVKIPVITVGGMTDPVQMEEIIAEGKADIIALARGLLADPFIPQKAQFGKDDEIIHCVRCFDCIGGMFLTRTMKCAVNPVIGREYECSFPAKPSEKKKVLIAGGGPAGMQAAITAAERGHDVTICEKDGSLGGALNFARDVSFKTDIHRFMETQIRRVGSLAIKVLLNTEVTPDFVELERPDVLIAAVGAEPIVLRIPGIDGASVIHATDVHKGAVKIGKKVVIIGGGLMGCETGLYLAQQGKDVTIIEMLDEIAIEGNIMHRRALMIELEKSVKLRPGFKCTKITSNGVTASDHEGKETLFEADTIITAVGMKSRNLIVDALRGTAPEFIAIGDCLKARRILQAVRTGYDAGMAI
jgi:2,4-dienoyl-CoA reductase-like NADH-dependent reductase (Old Yellow Enzyme family)/NADPH-dependent 2,4-dienoyl-CoA reductase/sulfur reductase-like enzyme